MTQRDFPEDTTGALRGLVVSPDGQQVAYERLPLNGPPAIWISPITGGAPARLVPAPGNQYMPTWSPDGKWMAFCWAQGGVTSPAKSRVGGTEPPQVLFETNFCGIPAWSPNGDWIACPSPAGIDLVSPDGKKKRALTKLFSEALVWSRDGAVLYAVTGRYDAEGARLVGLDAKTGSARTVRRFGDDFYFGDPYGTQRLTLAPDGSSFSASVFRRRTDLWILQGFNAGKGLLDWFR